MSIYMGPSNNSRRKSLKNAHIRLQISETDNKPLLYDGVDVHFSVRVFLKELFIHICFPLSVVVGKPCHLFLALHPAVSSCVANNIF